MRVRSTVPGKEHEEWETIDVPLDRPNPDITPERIEGGAAPEFLVEVVSPSGDSITMSVIEGAQMFEVEGGYQILPWVTAPNQFEEVTDG